MSDAKLWIDEAGCTATIAGVNVNYTMPLWVFDVMRDIIMTEAEKKVEVTHRDFDIQQELLDRYRAENATLQASNEVIAEDHAALCEQNAKLRELVRDMMRYYFMPSITDSKQREAELLERASELGVEEDNGELVVKVDG